MLQFSIVSQDFASTSSKWLREACPLALPSTTNPIFYLFPIPASLLCFYLGDSHWDPLWRYRAIGLSYQQLHFEVSQSQAP